MGKNSITKLLTENITKTYKKFNKKKISNINFIAKKITPKSSIDDRLQRMEKSEACISIKDQKD